jgi:hypothetical protein
MAFKFYLDGQLTDQPMNDKELSTSIKRDKALNNLLITQDVELLYNGNNLPDPGEISGYDYLSTLFFDTPCEQAVIEVFEDITPTQTIQLYKGIIKIPTIKVDLQKAVVRCKVEDNSFYGFINNNRTLKVSVYATLTKSNQALTPLQPYQLDLYNTINCNYLSIAGKKFQAFKVYDYFEMIVKALSDNNLGFQSDYLASLNTQLFICKGQNLLNPVTLFPNAQPETFEVSFNQLFSELSKIYNLVFWIDNTDVNNPILKVEDYLSSFEEFNVFQFDDIKELNVEVDVSQNYTDLKVGSSNVITGTPTNYPWPNGVPYFGWKEETYFPAGQCNVNLELDLINEFVIHSNSIQDAIVMNGTSLIDEYFLIECDNVDDVNFTADAVQFDYFNNGSCFYNINLNNDNKLQRHSSIFESQFGNFLGLGTDTFRALLGFNPTTFIRLQGVGPTSPYLMPNVGTLFSSTFPMTYINETTSGGFDNNNNYDTTTYEYTAPADGLYTFACQTDFQLTGITNPGNNGEWFTVVTTIITSSGQVASSPLNKIYSNGFKTANASLVVNLTTGDTVSCITEVRYQFWTGFSNPDVQNPRFCNILWTSFFTCNGTPDNGNTATVNNNLRKYLYTFDYDITQTNFQLLTNNITKSLTFEKDGIIRTGWIDSMKRNDWTGMTNIKLITNNAVTTQ